MQHFYTLSQDKITILLLALSYFLLVCFLICRQSLAKSSLRVGTLKTYLEVLHAWWLWTWMWWTRWWHNKVASCLLPWRTPKSQCLKVLFPEQISQSSHVLPGTRVAASSLGAGGGGGVGAVGFAFSETHFPLTPCLALGPGLSRAGLPAASLCFNLPPLTPWESAVPPLLNGHLGI